MAQRGTRHNIVRMVLAFLVYFQEEVSAFDCTARCNGTVGVDTVVRRPLSPDVCFISLPDNPFTDKDRIIPCQLEIKSNCSSYCRIDLTLDKFELDDCSSNLTDHNDPCQLVDGCEYVLVHEKGVDMAGQQLSHVTHMHGNQTSRTFKSQTDHILLQFCYRSETFSARNIQMTFKTVDPSSENQFYAGPVSVYVVVMITVLLAVGIGVVFWNKKVRNCLEPPPPPVKSFTPHSV